MLDAERAALLGRIGAHRLHATHDSRATTTKARAAFLERFEREVDPDCSLPADERTRRAEHARRAHFARLALQSAEARAERKSSAAESCAEIADASTNGGA